MARTQYKGFDLPDGLETPDVPADLRKLVDGGPIPRFANSTARDAALTTAPPIGTVCYNVPIGAVEVFYGATIGWRPPWNTAWGTISVAQNYATQTNITAQVDLSLLLVSWVALPGRRYRTHLNGGVYSSVGGDMPGIFITDQANSQKCAGWVQSPTNAVATHLECSLIESGLSGSITRKGRAQRNGSGLMSAHGTAQDPFYLMVEDIGPAANPA